MRSIALITLLLSILSLSRGDLVNTKVKRTIDLATQLARHEISLTAENSAGSAPAQHYTLILQNKYLSSHLCFLSVKDEQGNSLSYDESEDVANNSTQYKIKLATPLEAGKTTNLKISAVYSHVLIPYPTHISQAERQLVRYFDNIYFFSPYTTNSQKTTVKLASTSVEKFTPQKPSKHSGDTITYGNYEDVKPYTHAEMMIHYENNFPFLTYTKVIKAMEISHWGGFAVEQHLDFRHAGAVLSGQFSRWDFQRNPGASPAAIHVINEVLPREVEEVYYRDDIGNISTSTFAAGPTGNSLVFQITPRFPLFGGWKNNFYTGYNLPLHKYLSHSGDHFVLKINFASDLGNFYIEDYTLKVILPEGATNARVEIPFKGYEETHGRHYTYLDTTGRYAVILRLRDVVAEHNIPIQIHYQYSTTSMLHEPLLVTVGFLAFFMVIMFGVRCNLSLRPPVDKSKVQQKQREILAAVSAASKKLETNFTTITGLGESSVDSASYKRGKPTTTQELLTQISHQVDSAVQVGETFAEELKDFYQAQQDKFNVQSELHELLFEAKTAGYFILTVCFNCNFSLSIC
eukprot:TRINITY_DN2312_c0_g1_i1.p1 TRINITY_DN2312_c0_g1~~TRINITY_DN2312_c0_g1_i1.p1  ORF type:complete len:575 (-),score=154.45 TRINITY_DN2312_c0_g1_i1:153-1877(-)